MWTLVEEKSNTWPAEVWFSLLLGCHKEQVQVAAELLALWEKKTHGFQFLIMKNLRCAFLVFFIWS